MSITIHELSHALTAYRLGDPTAKHLGRITLNPVAHMDPLGAIMLLFLVWQGFGFGWGKPCPVNPHNLRNGPKAGMALVSLAGPLSNIALATALAVPLRFDTINDITIERLLFSVVIINIGLAVFNMIPLPPLDGFKVLLGLLPNRQAYALAPMENYGPAFLLLVIFFAPMVGFNLLGTVMRPFMALASWAILGRPIF
jgi:Zn-dependent protease